jgi:hypothetical protein
MQEAEAIMVTRHNRRKPREEALGGPRPVVLPRTNQLVTATCRRCRLDNSVIPKADIRRCLVKDTLPSLDHPMIRSLGPEHGRGKQVDNRGGAE